MADLDRIREALSFGARTGDLELMAAIYQLEPEGPEIEIDDGPKVIPRTCALCGVTYLVSQRHAENVPAESQFNTCQKCCLLYTSPSPRDRTRSRMPSSA